MRGAAVTLAILIILGIVIVLYFVFNPGLIGLMPQATQNTATGVLNTTEHIPGMLGVH